MLRGKVQEQGYPTWLGNPARAAGFLLPLPPALRWRLRFLICRQEKTVTVFETSSESVYRSAECALAYCQLHGVGSIKAARMAVFNRVTYPT